MKTRNYTDGNKRAILKIEVAVSVREMSYYFVASVCGREDFIEDAAKNWSKKRIMKEIRDEIMVSGTEHAGYFIGDNNLDDTTDVCEKIFTERFPEFS